MDNSPSVMLRPGHRLSGPFYLIVANLPNDTTWQQIMDFLKKYMNVRQFDIYVNLMGEERNHGWIRVVGYSGWHMVKRALDEHRFRGTYIVTHNPGYANGPGTVLIRAPYYKDRNLFVRGIANPHTSMGPRPSLPPAPMPGFANLSLALQPQLRTGLDPTASSFVPRATESVLATGPGSHVSSSDPEMTGSNYTWASSQKTSVSSSHNGPDNSTVSEEPKYSTKNLNVMMVVDGSIHRPRPDKTGEKPKVLVVNGSFDRARHVYHSGYMYHTGYMHHMGYMYRY
ncbi:hypothetical protein QBC39DRAFT_397388 [Podospora conica]|nr:hypothetical protein QBC39DRAFT_397388 [Schizothecium conicum]